MEKENVLDPLNTRMVVHVFGAMDRGGAEMRTVEVAQAVPASSVRMLYVTLSGREGELAEMIRTRGDDIVALKLGVLFAVRFARLLRDKGVDVVHSHVATFSGVPLFIAMLAGVKVRIAHFRSDGDQHGDRVRRRIQRHVMRFAISLSATHIVGVSPGALTFGFRQNWAQDPRCQVIPNGVDVDRLPNIADRTEARRRLGAGPETCVLCHVGKSDANKNRNLAVRLACALSLEVLSLEVPDVVLWLVGPIANEERAALSELAANGGRGHVLRILGTRSDVRDLLNAADVTLVTSRQEGLPGVILESLSVGTVVLASDLPGCRWIRESVNGVTLVDVAGSYRHWLRTLRRTVEVGRREGTRESVRHSFIQGPFLLKRSADALLCIWRS